MRSITPSHELMDKAIAEHSPIAVYALFSGGHDSLTATHIAAQHPAFTAAVHINTGIGIEETRAFVRETCRREGWPLKEYRAKDCGQDYRDMVLEQGFPGPPHHYKMYDRLKDRALRVCVKEAKHGIHDRVMLISGCRSEESTRRMGHVEPIQSMGVRVWVAPVHDWSKADTNDYLAAHKVPRNPVVDLIHMSGECLCGAYAHEGELAEIELWFPETAAHIKSLEKDVHKAGHHWGWEHRKPEWCLDADAGQSMLFSMCQSCDKREERRSPKLAKGKSHKVRKVTS